MPLLNVLYIHVVQLHGPSMLRNLVFCLLGIKSELRADSAQQNRGACMHDMLCCYAEASVLACISPHHVLEVEDSYAAYCFIRNVILEIFATFELIFALLKLASLRHYHCGSVRCVRARESLENTNNFVDVSRTPRYVADTCEQLPWRA
jgi:hypothetical protein